ncbi:MAG: hypothetical protein KKH98_02230, partial [Spirochaetes bacterium]|nr:hypothetical protein [Spirochaetota bacterium]
KDILNTVKEKSFLIESVLPAKGQHTSGFYYSYLNQFKRVAGHLYTKYFRKKESFSINAILKKAFRVSIDVDPIITKLISYFKTDYSYYKRIFKNIKPKAILLLQNGVQSGLLSAAQSLKIPVLEIQHGRVSFVHPVYSYNPDISYTHLDTFPDYFLSFSEYWNHSIHFPIREKIAIGNDYYYVKPVSKKKKREAVTVIFTKGLMKFTKQLSALCPDTTIYVKVRHSDEHITGFFNEEFHEHPNIRVIFDEKSVKDLFFLSHSIVAVESTTVYEALQSGTKVFIAAMMNYQTHEDVFNNRNVYLVKEAQDVVKNLKNKFFHSRKDHFFDKFNESRFRKVMKEVVRR